MFASESQPQEMLKTLGTERVVGFGLSLVGLFCIFEAIRLRIHPNRFGIGPSTFPYGLGIAFVLLGAYFIVARGRGKEGAKVALPRGVVARRMMGIMGTMIGYSVALPILGYAASTLLASVLLVKIMAQYRWGTSILVGVLIAGPIYFVFDHLIPVQFPSGLLWEQKFFRP